MATTPEYNEFVCERLEPFGAVRSRKMFGEYMVYVGEKPILLVCDNCVMVKKLPELDELMKDAPEDYPYEGAKAHYVLDIENRELTAAAIEILVRAVPLPKKKAKKRELK